MKAAKIAQLEMAQVNANPEDPEKNKLVGQNGKDEEEKEPKEFE